MPTVHLHQNGAAADPTPAAARDEAEQAHDEEQIEQIRRYEDFTTVDWIQDSLHERTVHVRRGSSRIPPMPTSRFMPRVRLVEDTLSWLWHFTLTLLSDGEDWLVVSAVGAAIGLIAALISILTEWLASIKLGYCTSGWWLKEKFCCLGADDGADGSTCADYHEWGGGGPVAWFVYVTCAIWFSLTAAHLVKAFAPYAAGSGISEIKCILGGFVIKGYLGTWTLIIKSLALPLAIASGLSVGKEGPSVHMACCVGNVIGGFFERFATSHTKMGEILTAASAAGVAVAFGSPIGGVLFAIEEMSHNFTNKTMWKSFVCALVAVVTLSAMNPYRTGKLVLFQVSYDRGWHYFEIPMFIIIGVFGGLYGAFVVKYNLQVASFRRKHLSGHGITEAVILSAATALVSYFNKFLRIDMTESMAILFKECEGGGDYDNLCQTWAQWRNVNTLLLATVVRTGFIILSYGCKVPAGIFVPSMAVGATFGRMVGIISKAMHAANPESSWFGGVCSPDVPCITPGTYALLGAAAALCGVTRMTVTVVVIMFEVTGALDYVLPTMIVVLVAKAVGDSFGKGGIADQMIKLNGYPFLEKEDSEGNDDAFLQPIRNIMKREIIAMRASGVPLSEIEHVLSSSKLQGFPVVKSASDATVVGYIRRAELRFASDKAKRMTHLSPDANCTFRMSDVDSSHLHRHSESAMAGAPSSRQPGDADGWEWDAENELEEALTEDARGSDHADFGAYVDQTPLCVSEKLPLEIVMQLFRRMGPRVILVTHEGKLVGLVTVKDVLRHEATMEHEHDAASPTAWEERQWEERVGLEGVLEEAWDWASGLFRFGRPRSPMSAQAIPEASDYELADRDGSIDERRGPSLPR